MLMRSSYPGHPQITRKSKQMLAKVSPENAVAI
jgi:hypothetical protein